MAGTLQNPGIGDQYQQAKQQYQGCKQRLTYFANQLAGSVTIVDGINMLNSLNNSISVLTAYAALPGLNAYAQVFENDPTFDAATAINNLVAAMQNTVNWITAHMPSTIYTPAQTAPLLALIQTAQAALV